MIMLIDREDEMKALLEIEKSTKAELVLVYGRRRVGKSRLLVEFAKKRDCLYLLADMSENILDIFARQAGEEFVKFGSWDDFFEFVCKCRHKTIIIDEFQYIYNINKAWPSILQRYWEKIKETDKKIILCGSIISTIYRIAKGHGSALYGRKTREIQLNPLRFKHISGFLGKYNTEELVRAYSATGGVPRYLEEMNPNESLEWNIKNKILDKTSFLYNEPMNLLFEEFRDPAPYVSILLAIAQGYTRFNDIAVVSKIHGNKLPKYLIVLERVRIIGKETPATERKIKARTTRYRIMDNFYRFWFTFVFRNKSMIEQGKNDELLGMIKTSLNAYVGLCFEDVCKEMLEEQDFTRVGRWWHKAEEIDIVAVNDIKSRILFAECKWKGNVDASALLSELKRKAGLVDWNKGKRKESYAIFAKSFKKKDDGALCLGLKDIAKKIKQQAK
ncbi:MAG: ATP-binding protein [Nanoarchaeota archaeon]|nr:ATP-binding protein [Nanoarchaeota archaeon]